MSCGCRKPRRGRAPAPQSGPKVAPPPQQRSQNQQFVLTTRTGSTLRFGSRLEADAANARQGWTGTVRPA